MPKSAYIDKHPILDRDVERLLHPDEQPLFGVVSRRMTGLSGLLTGGFEISPAEIDLPKYVVILATSQRLLLLAVESLHTDEKLGEVLMEVPIDQVGSVEKRSGLNLCKLTWTAAARQFRLLGGPVQVGELFKALELNERRPAG